MISHRTVFIFCTFVVTVSNAADCNHQNGGDRTLVQCNGGVSCILLEKCTGLYEQMQKGITPELRTLLRSLHCGFQDIKPKICCPPQFIAKRILLPKTDECGIMNIGNKIVGGSRTDLEEHPWMALLRYDKPNGWGFYCGGVLISSRYVLTAAHCVKGRDLPTDWTLAKVRLGEWNTSSEIDCNDEDCNNPPQDIRIERIIPHEQYDPEDTDQLHDIALLRLERNVTFTDYAKPICLPVSRELRQNAFEDQEMEVAGWGKTETRAESDVKLKVRVPIVSTSQCQRVYNKVNRRIYSSQLCAGGVLGRDSCRGDSGGSLMGKFPSGENWYALGVVSYGPSPCGTPNWPGVYTRVGAYVDWILDNLS